MTAKEVGSIKNDSQPRLQSISEIMKQSILNYTCILKAKLEEQTILQYKEPLITKKKH